MARKQHPAKKQFLVVWHCRDGARGCCTVLTSTSTALPPFTCPPNRPDNGDVALCSIQTKKKVFTMKMEVVSGDLREIRISGTPQGLEEDGRSVTSAVGNLPLDGP